MGWRLRCHLLLCLWSFIPRSCCGTQLLDPALTHTEKREAKDLGLSYFKQASWKRWQKDCKSQKIMQFSVRLCLLVMSETAPIKSHKHHCLNRMSPTGMSKWSKEKPMRSLYFIKNYRHIRKVENE